METLTETEKLMFENIALKLRIGQLIHAIDDVECSARPVNKVQTLVLISKLQELIDVTDLAEDSLKQLT